MAMSCSLTFDLLSPSPSPPPFPSLSRPSPPSPPPFPSFVISLLFPLPSLPSPPLPSPPFPFPFLSLSPTPPPSPLLQPCSVFDSTRSRANPCPCRNGQCTTELLVMCSHTLCVPHSVVRLPWQRGILAAMATKLCNVACSYYFVCAFVIAMPVGSLACVVILACEVVPASLTLFLYLILHVPVCVCVRLSVCTCVYLSVCVSVGLCWLLVAPMILTSLEWVDSRSSLRLVSCTAMEYRIVHLCRRVNEAGCVRVWE